VRLVSGENQQVDIALVAAVEGPSPAAAGSAGGPSAPGAAAPPDGEQGRSPAVLALGIVSTAAAIGLGVVAGVFFGKSAGYEDDYLAARDDYLALGETDGFSADEERHLYGDMKDARDGVATSDRVAVGTAVGAGVAAAASVVLWILYAKSGPESAEAAPVSLAPAPGGIVGSF
jgi:hypothetical protein